MSCEVCFNLPDEETEAPLRGRDLLEDHSAKLQSRISTWVWLLSPDLPFAHWGFSVWLMKPGAQPLQRERRLRAGEVWNEAERMGYVVCLQGLSLGRESEAMSPLLT